MRVLIASQYFPPEIHGSLRPAGRLRGRTGGASGTRSRSCARLRATRAGSSRPGTAAHFVEAPPCRRLRRQLRLGAGDSLEGARARVANYASYAATATLVGCRAQAAGRRLRLLAAASRWQRRGRAGASASRSLGARRARPAGRTRRWRWGRWRTGRIYRIAARHDRAPPLPKCRRDHGGRPRTSFGQIEGRGGAGKVSAGPQRDAARCSWRIGLEEAGSGSGWRADGRFTWTYAGKPRTRAGSGGGRGGGEAARGRLPAHPDRGGAAAGGADPDGGGAAAGTVEIREPIPPSGPRRLLRASDALLVSLAPGFDGFVPSKLFDFCAMARPVVLACDGRGREPGREAEAAICVPPGDPDALAGAIRRLAEDAGLRESPGAARQGVRRGGTRGRPGSPCSSASSTASWAKAFGAGERFSSHRRDELPGGRRGPMTALVTGSAGFIGSHLAESLLDDGVGVRGVDRFSDLLRPGPEDGTIWSNSHGEDGLRVRRRRPQFSSTPTSCWRRSTSSTTSPDSRAFGSAGGASSRSTPATTCSAPSACWRRAVTARWSRFVLASSSSIYGDAESFPHERGRQACSGLSLWPDQALRRASLPPLSPQPSASRPWRCATSPSSARGSGPTWRSLGSSTPP